MNERGSSEFGRKGEFAEKKEAPSLSSGPRSRWTGERCRTSVVISTMFVFTDGSQVQIDPSVPRSEHEGGPKDPRTLSGPDPDRVGQLGPGEKGCRQAILGAFAIREGHEKCAALLECYRQINMGSSVGNVGCERVKLWWGNGGCRERRWGAICNLQGFLHNRRHQFIFLWRPFNALTRNALMRGPLPAPESPPSTSKHKRKSNNRSKQKIQSMRMTVCEKWEEAPERLTMVLWIKSLLTVYSSTNLLCASYPRQGVHLAASSSLSSASSSPSRSCKLRAIYGGRAARRGKAWQGSANRWSTGRIRGSRFLESPQPTSADKRR